MACMVCDRAGCDECGNVGLIYIAACPLETIGGDVWNALKFIDLYEKGLPPIAGGALDQAQNFIEAAAIVFGLKQIYRGNIGKNGQARG